MNPALYEDGTHAAKPNTGTKNGPPGRDVKCLKHMNRPARPKCLTPVETAGPACYQASPTRQLPEPNRNLASGVGLDRPFIQRLGRLLQSITMGSDLRAPLFQVSDEAGLRKVTRQIETHHKCLQRGIRCLWLACPFCQLLFACLHYAIDLARWFVLTPQHTHRHQAIT